MLALKQREQEEENITRKKSINVFTDKGNR